MKKIPSMQRANSRRETMHLIQLAVVIVLLYICTTYVTVLRTCSSEDDKICICLALDLAAG